MLTLLLSSFLIQIPFSGQPDPGAIRDLQLIPGILSARFETSQMIIEIEDQVRISLSAIQNRLKSSKSGMPLLVGRIPVNRNVLFQVDAGQCFNCFEVPMRKSFKRESWVKSWSVVDYAPQGRFLFRIEPHSLATVEALEGVHLEEIWFTNRYDNLREINLDWPQAGIAWRRDEATAFEEARRLKKPLLIFPTAGT